jgi:hypothetical protein
MQLFYMFPLLRWIGEIGKRMILAAKRRTENRLPVDLWDMKKM